MNKKDYDFSGWATRNNIKCSDGRTIIKNAFKQNDGQKVPLVWNHQHDDPNEVLGHALLENRDDGVYAYCKFNNTESGQTAKALVQNGDVDKLSIYANKLRTQMNNVVHGCIREVSLVLAGANPGAYIDSVIMHGEGLNDEEEEGIIYNNETIDFIEHSDDSSDDSENNDKEDESKMDEEKKDSIKDDDKKEEKTIKDVFDTLNEEQKNAVYAIVGQVIDESKADSNDKKDTKEDTKDDDTKDDDNKDNNKENKEKGDSEDMKHNVFDKENNDEVLAHSEILSDALQDAKRYGSLRESVIEHAAINNITDISKLFPDATELYKEPRMIKEDETWVGKVMNAVKHTPFSRVKTTFGRMTEPEARAKGYIKGNQKTDIKMAILNRVTTPTTVYIKNEIDRDDVVDITDFDVVAWQKREMRSQLDKELALAMLLGDGRLVSDQNKINEQNIRPVIKDDELYTIQYTVTEGVDYKITANSYSGNDSPIKGVVRAAIKARKKYKGSGNTTFFTTEDLLDDLLLIEDLNGRRIYKTVEELATAMRCKEIVTIPEMEQEAYKDIYGVIVNMADYTAGADKGGSVNMFDDFDIDYNQMKYLMETRMSGALTVPYSAIVLKKASSAPTTEPEEDAEGSGVQG